MDTSQGTKAKKARYDRLVSGKDSVKARPLIMEGKYLSKKKLFF
jgi:hypothetical protein